MAHAGKFFVGIVIVLIFSEKGKAIKCYQCNSHNDTRCEYEKVPEDLLKDCPIRNTVANKDYILCRKIKQSIDFEVNGLPPDSRIIRSCGFIEANYKNKCYHKSGYGGRQEVCACDSDACNNGNALFASIFTVVAAIFSTKLF
ncbi:uncharacterized protein LOC108736682 [Agrilus planipennis]|uniref:Uncharacterized protein LOC108736682 n=1 Tax=Agrilus planipennis TaxID=224129 RepID=A0A1W4WLC3_AGRPL|nr:uncharacterized protein LOC108736682 [Agrilus planipennis]